jgi:hypothetical protein
MQTAPVRSPVSTEPPSRVSVVTHDPVKTTSSQPVSDQSQQKLAVSGFNEASRDIASPSRAVANPAKANASPAQTGASWVFVFDQLLSEIKLRHYSPKTLLRLAEYGDDILCRSKHSIAFGPPRPNVGEGSGLRGRAHSWSSSQWFKILIQSRVSGVDLPERHPPSPPAPLPRWGEGSRCSRLFLFTSSSSKCHYDSRYSIIVFGNVSCESRSEWLTRIPLPNR